MKKSKHIWIARTNNTPFSSMSLKSCLMIQEVLRDVYEKVEISTLETIEDLEQLVQEKPDLVFLGLKRLPNESGNYNNAAIWVSDYLEQHHINYTGSKKRAIELDFDKEEAKIRVSREGVSTAPFFTASVGEYKNESGLPLSFPLFVKPLCAGGGKGVDANSVVYDFAGLQSKVLQIKKDYGTSVLVEQYLSGREFSVAILEKGGKRPIIMPMELIVAPNENGDCILGSGVKTADTERAVRILDKLLRARVSDLAFKAYKALGARDFGRIDIRMNEKGDLYFLEANLVPGLADTDFTSYFNRACYMNEGMRYEDVIFNITSIGLDRGS